MSSIILCKTLCFSPRCKNIILILCYVSGSRCLLVGTVNRVLAILRSVQTTPDKFENGVFSLKTHQMFSVHTMPGFAFEENSVTWLSWRHRIRKPVLLSPGQADRQVFASGRKLNLRGDLRWVAKRTRKVPRKFTLVTRYIILRQTNLYFIG